VWYFTAALFVSCAFARRAGADEPVRVEVHDPGAYPPPAARWGLLAVGAGTTLAWYGGSVGASYLWPDAPGARDLRVPVVGPWLALGDTGCADDNPGCSKLGVILRAVITALDGVAQAGGIAVMGEALFLPTANPRPERARTPRRYNAGSVVWKPAPIFTGKDQLGLGIVGQF
jgi:hypothetical protein